MGLTWLDLCSGLGGASQPALDRGWRVIRVDIEPRFKPDVVADIRNLPLMPFGIDVLWVSPSCDEFARATLHWKAKAPWTPCPDCDDFWCNIHRKHVYDCKCPGIEDWIPRSPYEPFGEPDISIVRAALQAVRDFNPRFWVIENTIHSRKWVTPILGPTAVSIAGHYFWGKLPCLLPNVNRIPKESLWPRANRASERAKIPYAIGEAICIAVERRRQEASE